MQTTAMGNFLGSSTANYITSRNNKTVSLDSGYTIGQKARCNSTQYRSNGYIVRTVGANAKCMTTLKSPQKKV